MPLKDVQINILLIEDSPDDEFLFREFLSDHNKKSKIDAIYKVNCTRRISETIEISDSLNPDLIFVDLSLPDSSGLDTFKKVQNTFPEKPIIVLTGLDNEKLAVKSVSEGAQDYIVKSDISEVYLKRAIKYAIERNNYKLNLNKSLSLLEATLEATADGIIAVATNGRITNVNSNFIEMWELSDTISQINQFDHLISVIREKIEKPGKFIAEIESLKTQQKMESYSIIELKNEKIFEVKSRPQIIENKISGRVWSFNDISAAIKSQRSIKAYMDELQINQDALNRKAYELFQANQKLKKSEDELKNAIATRDKFFSIIAHDLKSPFTTFLGISGMLLESYDEFSDAEKKGFVSSINKTAQNILNLLENLLDWSRLQSDTIDFYPEYLNMFDSVESTINLLSDTAKAKKIKLENNLPPSVLIFADQNMIDTVIRNLISNAIKFTPENGKISMSVKSKKDFVEFFVSDTGIGIEEKDIPKIFDAGINYTTPGTKQEKGTGLGLLLCKELVDKNGGRIKVSSKKNIGSTFSFTVPKKEKS